MQEQYLIYEEIFMQYYVQQNKFREINKSTIHFLKSIYTQLPIDIEKKLMLLLGINI